MHRITRAQTHKAPLKEDAMLACLRKASGLQWQAVKGTGATAEAVANKCEAEQFGRWQSL